MSPRFAFNRLELAGCLGDLGALLPIAIAMVLVVGINPVGLFLSIALFYLVSGTYFGVTVPVQPMKVIGAYAVATAMTPAEISASSLIMACALLLIGLTGNIDFIRKNTEKSVIRGVQLTTGALLIAGGIKFILGKSHLQNILGLAEPYLRYQSIGPVPLSILLGCAAIIITFAFLSSKKYPAALVVIGSGTLVGVIFAQELPLSFTDIGIYFPQLLPYSLPKLPDLSFALIALVLPQLPMTLGNAVIAYTDLSKEYFGQDARKITNKAACLSMAGANFMSFLLGGMPLCHGAGGLAAHYRFGARTAGSNIIIGLIFLGLALFLGDKSIVILNLLPLSVLGALLIFAGAQLTMTIIDLEKKEDYFVATMILGISLATNLAIAFIVGLALTKLLKSKRFSL